MLFFDASASLSLHSLLESWKEKELRSELRASPEEWEDEEEERKEGAESAGSNSIRRSGGTSSSGYQFSMH